MSQEMTGAPMPAPASPSRSATPEQASAWAKAIRAEREAAAKIESALAAASYELHSAEKAAQAAQARIGAILRYARAGQTTGLVGMTHAEYITDVSRQSLTRWRDNPQPWEELVGLAKDAAVYGDDHGAETELRARLPWYGAWGRAAEHLQRLHDKAYEDKNGGFDPMTCPDTGDDPGAVELKKVYRDALGRISDGNPL